MSTKDFIKVSAGKFHPVQHPQAVGGVVGRPADGSSHLSGLPPFLYRGGVFPQFCGHAGGDVRADLYGNAGHQHQCGHLAGHGGCTVYRAFRTAVKDPMDLLYLFWSITTGITTGAGMYLLALTAAVVMILMLLLFYQWQERGRVYIAVIHYTGQRAGMTSSVPSAETSMSSSLRQCAAIQLRWLPRCSVRTRSLNFQTACAPYPALPM